MTRRKCRSYVTITGDATLPGLYHLEQGGNDIVTGGSGNDGFYFGNAFTGADHVNGGAGTNLAGLATTDFI